MTWLEDFDKLPEIIKNRLSLIAEQNHKKIEKIYRDFNVIIKTHYIIHNIQNSEDQYQKAVEYLEQQNKSTIEPVEKNLPNRDLCRDCINFYINDTTNCSTRIYYEQRMKLVGIDVGCDKYKPTAKVLPYKSLNDIHITILKFFPNIDTKRIDLRLAWGLAIDIDDDNLWIAELSRSSKLKSTFSEPQTKCSGILSQRDVTPKAYISAKEIGGKPVNDFGLKLTRRKRGIVIPETASIKAMNDTRLTQLMSTWKQLFDKNLKVESGSGVEKEYPDCFTSLWINSTKDFRKHAHAMQEVGTCFLIYDVPPEYEKDEKAIENALKNQGTKKKIQTALTYIYKCFLAHHSLQLKELDDDIKKWIIRESKRLSKIRTSGSYDNQNELQYLPEPELGTRIAKQLSLTYQALISLDDNYDKKKAKEIVECLVDSSGDPVTVKVLDYIDTQWSLKEAHDADKPFTINEVKKMVRLGYIVIKQRLELLVGLEVLDKVDVPHPNVEKKIIRAYQINEKMTPEQWQIYFRRNILNISDTK